MWPYSRRVPFYKLGKTRTEHLTWNWTRLSGTRTTKDATMSQQRCRSKDFTARTDQAAQQRRYPDKMRKAAAHITVKLSRRTYNEDEPTALEARKYNDDSKHRVAMQTILTMLPLLNYWNTVERTYMQKQALRAEMTFRFFFLQFYYSTAS